MQSEYDCLKISNQLCFPLYACSKELIKQYREPLQELGLTYTQYLVMMVLWEFGDVSVRELGEKVMLDSGTLTPLLKRLEKQGLITRHREASDERVLIISLTDEGLSLRDRAINVPFIVGRCLKLSQEEAQTLYDLLYKALSDIHESDNN